MTPHPTSPGPHPAPSVGARPLSRLALALGACLALYGIVLACVGTVPAPAHAYAANMAAPFDLMVCVPAAFYLLAVRPRRLSPVLVLPVIYLGFLTSMALATDGGPSLALLLLAPAAVVDVVVLAHEGRRLVRAYRASRTASSRPLDWFAGALFELSRNERASHMFGMELCVWYYALASWRREPDVPAGTRAFTCYRDNGYLALVGVMLAVLAIETFAVHLLVMQWSAVAAAVLTAFSVYMMFWMLGTARAAVLNPILVDDEAVTLRWGFSFCERIPLALIAGIEAAEPDVPKRERVNLAVMGSQPCWIVLAEPTEVRTFVGGRRRVRALSISPDEAGIFKRLLQDGIAARAR